MWATIWFWELSIHALLEQQVLYTANPSLRSAFSFVVIVGGGGLVVVLFLKNLSNVT